MLLIVCIDVIFLSTSSTGVSYEQGVDFLAGCLLSQIFCFENCIPSAEAQFVAFLSIRFPTLLLRFVLPRRFGAASVGELPLFAYDCLVQCVNCLIEESYSCCCVSGTGSLAHSLTSIQSFIYSFVPPCRFWLLAQTMFR